jgi:Autographiviridae exonuclease
MDIAAYVAKAAAAKPMPLVNVPDATAGLVVHMDGDYCAYYCAGNDDCDAGRARYNITSRLDTLRFASGATSVVMHLTDARSTKGDRYLAATVKPYQGQRGGAKPKNWDYLREYMEGYEGDKFTPKMWNTREADDGIAYVAHHMAQHGKLAVISTRDKDMRMLPGRHVVWLTNELIEVPFNAFEVIGSDEKIYGHKWFWIQMLQGDGADNIPGVPGIGEKYAPEFMKYAKDNETAFDIVSGQYTKKYPGAEAWDRLVEQASLLWLRTDRYAELDNFMQIMPKIPELTNACAALRMRVAKARAALQGMQ